MLSPPVCPELPAPRDVLLPLLHQLRLLGREHLDLLGHRLNHGRIGVVTGRLQLARGGLELFQSRPNLADLVVQVVVVGSAAATLEE